MDKPQRWKSNTFTTSHNHYDASGSSTLALTDFTSLSEEITEHGYGLNGGKICFVSQGTAKDIADLAGWTTAMTANNLVDSIANYALRSKVDNILGFTMIIDDWIPDDYMFGLAIGTPSVAVRSPRFGGGGLKYYAGPFDEYPIKESYFKRRFGMVVSNRGAGAVREITASSYSSLGSQWTFEA